MISISNTEQFDLVSKIQILEEITSKYLNSINEILLTIRKEEIYEFKCIRIPSEEIYEFIKAVNFILGNEDNKGWNIIKCNFYKQYMNGRIAKLHENYIMTEDIKEIVYPILYESGFDPNALRLNSLVVYKLYLWADNFCKFTESKQSLEKLKICLSEIERN
ncbi:hypothetical protein SteCoe_12278 [Stentor coeruleus]|uniref:Uncharacterized protein n=1 Tax=Stentor coeruleus TaxID=5963 RepID=A0A1R2CB41_9CILI|nr:hypothetical protein SteCoe_12278 [Stentor coeruleus]